MTIRPTVFLAQLFALTALSALAWGEEEKGHSAQDLLDALLPGEAQVAEFGRLVEQLGSEKFKERKDAMESLLAAPLVPQAVLEKGLKSGEPEIVERVKEVIKQGGSAKSEAILEEALRTLEKEGTKGLLGKIAEVLESGVQLKDAGLGARVAAGTAEAGDADLLQEMAAAEDAVRREMAAAGCEVLGKEGAELLRGLLKDDQAAVKLRAAIAMTNLGEVEGARALADFLSSDKTAERMTAWRGLQDVTGKEFGYSPLDSADKRREAVTKWSEFLKGEIALEGKVGALKSIALFNGKDLSGWTHFRGGKAVAPKDKTWQVKDGVLICPGKGPGDLRSNAAFKDYVLVASYRASDRNADSGIGLMMTEAKVQQPPGGFRFDGGDYLEVQLLPGRSGDLYRIGNFKGKADGKDIGFSARRKKEVKEPLNQWHELRLEVRKGHVKVFVNGTLVNEADGPEEPGKILLREERFSCEFREITLLPIEG